jgi:hypothetical protein
MLIFSLETTNFRAETQDKTRELASGTTCSELKTENYYQRKLSHSTGEIERVHKFGVVTFF